MAAMQRFSVPHASPEIILSERKYSRGFLRAACRHCTRLWGRRSLSVSHTMPTVALPVGKCSPVFCPPHAFSSRVTPFTYPSNGGMGAPPPWLRMALALLLRDSEAPPDFSRTKKSGASAPLLRCPYCEGQGAHPHVCPWPLAFQFIALVAYARAHPSRLRNIS